MTSESDVTYKQTGELDRDPSLMAFDDVQTALHTSTTKGLSSEEAGRAAL